MACTRSASATRADASASSRVLLPAVTLPGNSGNSTFQSEASFWLIKPGYRRSPRAISVCWRWRRPPHAARDSSTRSWPRAWRARWMRFAELRWRGSSIRRTDFSSIPRRAASAAGVTPVRCSASASAAFAAVSGGTATRYSLAQRRLGTGMQSARFMRPAMASSSASAAWASASASLLPEVRHSGRSRKETTSSPVQSGRRRAG